MHVVNEDFFLFHLVSPVDRFSFNYQMEKSEHVSWSNGTDVRFAHHTNGQKAN